MKFYTVSFQGMKVNTLHLNQELKLFEFTLSREESQRIDTRFDFDKISCTAELKKDNAIIQLSGRYQATLTASCDLCLVPFQIELDNPLILDLIPQEHFDPPTGDTELTLDTRDSEVYEGDELDLSQYFEDQLLLDLPVSLVCSDDCKGICSQCGGNLNESACDCARKTTSNNPFAVLAELDLDQN